MKQGTKYTELLRAVFRAMGGPRELESVTGIPEYNFSNWTKKGQIPLITAYNLSKELDISKWGLNYPDFSALEEDPPSWEEVVKSYFLPKKVVDKLLKGTKKCQKKKKKKKKK